MVSVAGTVPVGASKVFVSANGVPVETAADADGTFTADVVVRPGANAVSMRTFDASGPVGREAIVTLHGAQSSPGAPNALVASRVLAVLRPRSEVADLDIVAGGMRGAGTAVHDAADAVLDGLLRVDCHPGGACSLTGFDAARLEPVGAEPAFESAHQRCMAELEAIAAKSGGAAWHCGPDGAKTCQSTKGDPYAYTNESRDGSG